MKTGDLYKAFKDAQLEVRKKSPDPFFWGAFVLIGK
jgi:CHAT domain-containing protein